MSAAAWGRTWEDAAAPSATRLARRFEEAWRDSAASGSRPDPRAFLAGWTEAAGFPGARLAILRADMSLRWEAGENPPANWYAQRFPEIGEDTVIALIYEEFCLREEAGETPSPADFLTRYAPYAGPLERVFGIHELVDAGSTAAMPSASMSTAPEGEAESDGGEGGGEGGGEEPSKRAPFPKAGETVAGFRLVEELGRGSFARVFLAREIQLADRLVALKVSRRGSREPQTLARLQHTHIVPVYSHRVDPDTGLHVLCMPYFGRATLGRVLAEVERDGLEQPLDGRSLVEALDRLEPTDGLASGPSSGRAALAGRSFPRAVAWWAARLTEALGLAHDRGVLHRDIKPSNVLIAADGTPMLLDFNLAHESIDSDGRDETGANLGGTIDYMAPEHLEALAGERSDHIDARSDLFSMGVLLYEAALGDKPFPPPRKTGPIIEVLLRAADDRGRDPRALFPADADIPAPLQAVIERCLAPDPTQRYQSAYELADDLQAVADDLPLLHAREPLTSRLVRRLRRQRFRLAAAALILLSLAAVGFAVLSLNIERAARYEQGRELFDQGNQHLRNGDYEAAIVQFEAASQLARRSEEGVWRHIFRWRSPREIVEKLNALERRNNLDQLDEEAGRKASLAKRHAETHRNVAALHAASDNIRMRLIGLGDDLPGAVAELQNLLKPFYVLSSREDWTTLDYLWSQLDEPSRIRLRREVNELLFLWMVGVESSARPADAAGPTDDQAATIRRALEICDRAIRFATPAAPWVALRGRLQARLPGEPGTNAAAAAEPKIDDEDSALACFQWGLLNSSRDRRDRAIDWLQRAVRIEGSNYWYQFYLGFLEDQAGLTKEALEQYGIAAALRPESPWVLFSRARLNRARGRWAWAIEDLNRALGLMAGRPEAPRVRLELGYVHQALGDFAGARRQYEATLATDPTGPLGRAARLNLANLDAESGLVDRARAGYAELLESDPDDAAARYSRALLDLRVGHPESAASALDLLLDGGREVLNRGDLLATRAAARMILGRGREAVADAREAARIDPKPSRDRLVSRALLAAGMFDSLQLDRPEEAALFPLGGDSLRADLRRAEEAIARSDETFRAGLTRAVILAMLGRNEEALATARRAMTANQNSSHAHLIVARLAHAAGDRREALDEVEKGLRLRFDSPELFELRGRLRLEEGDPVAALADLDLAAARSEGAFVHAARAEALAALGRGDEAALEWTRCLNRDPELSFAYLGRARGHIDMDPPRWDLALADLERAATWSRNDPRIELGILAAYARCLHEHPDRTTRWLALAGRSALHAWSEALSLAAPVDAER